MDVHWQVQEAKQRFSELLRRVQSDGVQFVTKHGKDVAVVMDIEEYRRLTGHTVDFKTYLMSMPPLLDLLDENDLRIGREIEPERPVFPFDEVGASSDDVLPRRR